VPWRENAGIGKKRRIVIHTHQAIIVKMYDNRAFRICILLKDVVSPLSMIGGDMKLSIEQVENATIKFVGKDAEAVARATGFVQRISALGGRGFLRALVLGLLEKDDLSLSTLAQVCADIGIEITPQGVDQRITDRAVAFVKIMFSRAIDMFKNQIPLPLPILRQFNGIYLTDSSVVALPDTLAEDFAGCGGNGPKASLKIQLVFEFLCGNLIQVALRPGREPDQSYRDYIQAIPEGALSIVDLGYFVLDAIKAIMYERNAYFLTRFRTHTGLLTPQGKPFNLLERLQSGPREPVEFPVLLGKQAKHRLPCRLIVLPVPQEVADRRRQKARKKSRCQKKTPNKETLALMDWTIFVTNVPTEMLSMQQIAILYSVRWQIELVFKLWKSHCGLRRIAGFRRERVLVELYGKLIGAVITHFLVAPLRMPEGALSNREISPVKVRKIFQRFARELNRCLNCPTKFQVVLANMLSQIQRFGFKEKRKKEPNVCHALALASAVWNIQHNSHSEMLLA
jgi:hypothetical protein